MLLNEDFLNIYEELSEAYNIPYSGYVITNDDGTFYTDVDKVKNNHIWTADLQEAAIFKTEEDALKAKAWLLRYYEKDLGFYIKYLESNSDLEKAELEKMLFKILESWHEFIEAGTVFQKLCNKNDFENFDYTIADYKNKKPTPDLLIYNIQNNNNIDDTFKRLQHFVNEVIKESKLEDTNKELVDKVTKFAQAWNKVKNVIVGSSYRLQLVELLQNNK